MVAAKHTTFDFIQRLVGLAMPLQRQLRPLWKRLIQRQAANVVQQSGHEKALDVGLAA